MRRKQASDPLNQTYVSLVEFDLLTGAEGARIHRREQDGSPYVSEKDLNFYAKQDLEFWEEYIMYTPEWEKAMEALEELYDTSDVEIYPKAETRSIVVYSIENEEYDMRVSDSKAWGYMEKQKNNMKSIYNSVKGSQVLRQLQDTHNKASKAQVDKVRQSLFTFDLRNINQMIDIAYALEDKKINDVIREFLDFTPLDINSGTVWMTVQIFTRWKIATRGGLSSWEDSEEESFDDSDWY